MSAKKKLKALRAAYAGVTHEFAEYRQDRQEQMTRIRAALDDAYTGARTGNMMTPPWVVQSIDDARAAGGWTMPPRSSERSWSDMDAAKAEADAARVLGPTEPEEESGQRSGECEHGDHAVCDGTTPGWPCECSCHESSER